MVDVIETADKLQIYMLSELGCARLACEIMKIGNDRVRAALPVPTPEKTAETRRRWGGDEVTAAVDVEDGNASSIAVPVAKDDGAAGVDKDAVTDYPVNILAVLLADPRIRVKREEDLRSSIGGRIGMYM